jgi:hypothetical protein
MLHQAGQFRNQLIQRFIFSEKFWETLFFFANSGQLQTLKVRDLKLFNRQTSGESASLPQYLGCNTVFDMRLRYKLRVVTFGTERRRSLGNVCKHRSMCQMFSLYPRV